VGRNSTLIALAALATVLSGCAGVGRFGFPLTDAPVMVGTVNDALEAEARQAYGAGNYEHAGTLYLELSRSDTDPERQADFLFLAGESALGEQNFYVAYRRYSDLLKKFPLTSRFSTVVERVFLVARRFAEGVADKPSWLFGIDMSDRQLGIDILTEFQKARERHPLADDALHWKAMALVEMGEYQLAIATWTKLRTDYPESEEWFETAQYRIGLTMLRLSEGVDYDKGPIHAGYKHLKQYVKANPKGNHVTEAESRIAELEEALADQLFDTAKRYLWLDQDYAATLYLDAILRDYPATEMARGEAKTLRASIPKSSPPPARPDPEELEGPLAVDVQRFRLPPPDRSGLNPKPGD
jgi:TolA-binding protein